MYDKDCMVIVTDVKVSLVPRHTWEIAKFQDSGYLRVNDGKDVMPIEVIKETIKGHKFVKLNGQCVYLGMAKHVQEAIGIPLEAFDEMRNDILCLSKTNGEYLARLIKVRRMSFWQRLVGLFKGFNP